MSERYIDDFLTKQGFDSTDGYLVFCTVERITPQLKGVGYFKDLFARGRLREGSIVRTMYTSGTDNCYEVTGNGTLTGIALAAHSGKPGEFNPEDILSLDKAPDGWMIEGRVHVPTELHERIFTAYSEITELRKHTEDRRYIELLDAKSRAVKTLETKEAKRLREGFRESLPISSEELERIIRDNDAFLKKYE